jgi:hypothetical protein
MRTFGQFVLAVGVVTVFVVLAIELSCFLLVTLHSFFQ